MHRDFTSRTGTPFTVGLEALHPLTRERGSSGSKYPVKVMGVIISWRGETAVVAAK